MRKVLLVLFAASPFIAAAIPFLLLALAFWEPTSVRPGTLAYLLAIPSSAKDFPLWKPCGSASYSHRAQDGTAPEMYWIDYESKLSKSTIEQKILDYTKTYGCESPGRAHKSIMPSELDLGFVCSPAAVELRFTSSPPRKGMVCRPVTIFFVDTNF